jgi:HEAT repeat protein
MIHSNLAKIAGTLILCASACSALSAQVPDFTKGGRVPEKGKSSIYNVNLGPTGLGGWMYADKVDTSKSRQILIRQIDEGSPAHGKFEKGDVILGVDGTGATPKPFTADSRRTFASAINEAEARDPATLKLLRWREGRTDVVSIELKTLGRYSPTAPFKCAKSARILEDGLAHVMKHQRDGGLFHFGALALLAADDPSNPDNAARQALAEELVKKHLLPDEKIDDYMSGVFPDPDKITKEAWNAGYKLFVLCEYYLKTADKSVLPSIEAYAMWAVSGASMFGTYSHGFGAVAIPSANNEFAAAGYGAVNSCGLVVVTGLLLAKECGIEHPSIDKVIGRASDLFSSYVGRGTIPYGEGEPNVMFHGANGKSGQAALFFSLQPERKVETQYFARFAAAGGADRDRGHGGSIFGQLWTPSGALLLGTEAFIEHFSRIHWTLDLNRTWDGGFDFNTTSDMVHHSNTAAMRRLYMSSVALLTYAIPNRQLFITGSRMDPSLATPPEELDRIEFADRYQASARSSSELLEDLANWSPVVRRRAAMELGGRSSDHAKVIPKLAAILKDPSSESRLGAAMALGQIGDKSTVPLMVELLNDPDVDVAYASASALRHFDNEFLLPHADKVLAAAIARGKPMYPFDFVNDDDPIQIVNGRISSLLFSTSSSEPRGFLVDHMDDVDRKLLYPAIRALSQLPQGSGRRHIKAAIKEFTEEDMYALKDTLLYLASEDAPAGMFGMTARYEAIDLFARNDIAEGVSLAKKAKYLRPLSIYGASALSIEPDIVEFLEFVLKNEHPKYHKHAKDALEAIASDKAQKELRSLND